MTSLEETSAPEPEVRPRRLWVWPVTLALAALFLYLALRKVDLREVWHIMARGRMNWFLLAIGFSGCAYLLRAFRWRILLNTHENLGYWPVFWANNAGYFGSNVLPARAGELVRTAMIASRSRLSRTFVFTTAIAERVVDLIVLLLLGLVVVQLLGERPAWLLAASVPMGTAGIVGAVVVFFFSRFEPLLAKIVGALPVGEHIHGRLLGMLGQIAAGMRAFESRGRMARFFLLTVCIWGLDAFGAMAFARGLGLTMPLTVALLLLVGLGMGSSLPSTPGYVGIFQLVAVTVLVPFHFSRADAIAFILVAQAGSVLLTACLGLTGILYYRATASPTAKEG